jgi:beta-xylosidase
VSRVRPASSGSSSASSASSGSSSASSASAASASAGSDSAGSDTIAGQIWRDRSRPAAERVKDLLSRMSLEEKVAQLTSIWVGDEPRDGDIAPMQGEMGADPPPLSELIRHGLGQVTRVFGTRPLPPAVARGTLRELQAEIAGASRFGIPAVAHEECLTGFAAWTATVFPTPLAWGASFDPELVREMAGAIGASMRSVGIHQGLAPVLDVARDTRWGRTEESIGEDPYLVGSIGTGYVRGLQSAGVQATLKHFVGYSASRAGRNMAPVSMGPREFADVLLVPFEMALRLGGARSVMPAYPDVDGVPASGDRTLLTGLLRDELGFDGVVVSDYYAISFLQTEHAVAGTIAQAAALALEAGLDVELPNVRCYGDELVAAVRDGQVPAELVDRAAARVLRQKCDLGLLDADWSPAGHDAEDASDSPVDLDPPGHRALARRLAEESVVLLANGGDGYRGAVALPLRPDARIAVIGPLANDPLAFFGCYSMARHLGNRYPEAADGVHVTTLVDALAAELPGASVSQAAGCRVCGEDRSGFAAAAAHAQEADVVVAVLGDQAGLFARGTSGEGCDAPDLRLPGVQEDLLRALVATGTPVVLVLVTGRPYAIGPVAGELAAAVQAFFPGEEGGTALAGVLSGRVVPSGRLPVELPALAGSQPSSYLRPRLAGRHPGSSTDPTPLFAFGHGLSYTTFEYADVVISPAEVSTLDGTAEISCTVRNTGSRAGTEVVQLYLSDPVAQVVRPLRWLAGFARVALDPGQARRVTFRLHADRTAFCGRDRTRVVEPGEIRVAVGGASDRLPLHGSFTLCGAERPAGPDRVLDTPAVISDIT